MMRVCVMIIIIIIIIIIIAYYAIDFIDMIYIDIPYTIIMIW